MAWVTPTSVSTGDTLQASEWNQSVVLNSLMGQPVFTNEAARDAAISSPSEGQVCYLTAPTVPAATGGTTYVPTGITTVYNGSAWVCVTEVGAYTSDNGSTTSATFTTTLSSGGTNPTVTLSTGATAFVAWSLDMYNSGGSSTLATVSVSGATTIAAIANIEMITTAAANQQMTFTAHAIISGLTAGSNTFSLNYRTAGNTGQFLRRRITVKGIA